MAQANTGLLDEAVNGTLTSVEYNTLINTVDANAADAESRLAALESNKEDDLGAPQAAGMILSSDLQKNRAWINAASGEDQMWALSMIGVPVFYYGTANTLTESTGELKPNIVSGGKPTNWSITSGSIPTEYTFDSNTGVISFDNGTAEKSGTFGITATNPYGNSAELIINFRIKNPAGVAHFTNTEWVYPSMRVDSFHSNKHQVLHRLAFHGRTTAASNGTLISDATYPIYVASNGNGTWNYVIFVSGTQYWTYFKNSQTDPATLTDALITDLRQTELDFDYVAPAICNVIVGGINYPSARGDIHWNTTESYITFKNTSNLNGFLSNDVAWSYGFKLVDPIPRDGLGRVSFARDNRSFHGFTLSANDNQSVQFFGSGVSGIGYSKTVTPLPSGGFAAGTYIRVTHAVDGTIELFANGTKYFSGNSAGFFDNSNSLNTLNVRFGNSIATNTFQYDYTTDCGGWQGRIERLWISNGVVENVDDNGTVWPPRASHTWALSETSGSRFAALTGNADGIGVNAT